MKKIVIDSKINKRRFKYNSKECFKFKQKKNHYNNLMNPRNVVFLCFIFVVISIAIFIIYSIQKWIKNKNKIADSLFEPIYLNQQKIT